VRQSGTADSSPDLFFWLLFIGMAALSLLPIWLFTYFPSQDGPAHLNSVAVLMALEGGQGGGVLEAFYTAQWRVSTNQLGFLLLQGLGSFLPLLVAEKVLLSLYAVGLPLATLTAIRWARGNPYAALLSFPLVFTLPLYMGFYNFCLSLPLFVLCVGLYFAFSLRPSWGRGVALSLLLVVLYLTHVVTAASAVVVIVVAVLARIVGEKDRREVRRQGAALLTLLPSGLFIATFLLFFRQYSARPAAPEVTVSNQVARFLSGFVERIGNVLSPYEKIIYLLDGFSAADRLYTVPYFGLLFLLSLSALVQLVKAGTLRCYLPHLVAALCFIVLLAVVPERYGSLGWLPGRFLPVTCLVLIVGVSVTLSHTVVSRTMWRFAAVVTLLIVGISTFYRLPVHRQLNAAIGDYVAATASVPPDAVVLPLQLASRYQHEGLKPLLRSAKFNALAHAAGYATLDAPFVNLRNFEPARPYFPLQYTATKDPRIYLSPDEQPSRYGMPPFHLDLSAYAEHAKPVDYVLVWGNPDLARDAPGVADLYAQLADGYVLVEPDTPSSLMHVYKRKPDAPSAAYFEESSLKGTTHD